MLRLSLYLLVSIGAGIACSGTSLAEGVKVDPVKKRAEIVVERPGGRIVIYLEPLSNLLMHTFNMYKLFAGQGEDYTLRSDETARRAVSREIQAEFGGPDKYFSRQGKVNFYSPTMTAFLKQQAYLQPPDDTLLAALAPAPFNAALIKTWKEFYRDYWGQQFERLSAELRKMDDSIRWSQMLERMEQVAGRKWQGVMQVFAVEATGRSAFTFAKTTCIGTLAVDNDAGFVHEGLHLLLQKDWSRSPRIAELMADAGFQHKFWGSDWASFYEQAFVVLAEMHLRDVQPRKPMPRKEFLRLNLEANGAGELSDIAFAVVLPYLQNPDGRLDELMWEFVRKAELNRRGAAQAPR